MLFNSLQFLFFLTAVLVIYYMIPNRFRWFWILLCSYYFYMKVKPVYILLLVFISIITYFSALLIKKYESKKKRKYVLWTNIALSILPLLIFKYYNFISNSISDFLKDYYLSYQIPILNLSLPIGISFYIFKSISYIIDVYRGENTIETHLGRFSTYIAFFPQLLAGPIERAKRFLPQMKDDLDFNKENFANGLRLILWGFFQKVVIADNLAVLVDTIYNNPYQYRGFTLSLATIFFSFQIYCDFSGYSDIAIGVAQLMGITTMANFDRPYFASSIQEFWRRWHISLSTWLRDYIYIPLGGSRVRYLRHYLNIIVVMLICGLWHGANWTFMIWGAIHGMYLIISLLTKELRNKFYQLLGLDKNFIIRRFFKIIITFSLISFAWIFFRANSVFEACYIIKNIFKGWGEFFSFEAIGRLPFLEEGRFETIISIISIGILLFLEKKGSFISWISKKPITLRWVFYYFLILMILICGNFGQKQFIYFQF